MWLFSGSKSVTLSWICWFEKRNNVPTFEQARAVTRFSFRTRGARSSSPLGLDGMEWISLLSSLLSSYRKTREGSGRAREGDEGGRREEVGGLVGESNSNPGMRWPYASFFLLLILWHHIHLDSRVRRVEST